VRVTLEGSQLNDIGILVDFVDIKRVLRDSIEYLDHRFVNDLPPFDVVNPTAENMAKYFYEQVQGSLEADSARVKEVLVWETDTSVATYRP
jgi:6-pyruvoyltetrahydropterin/6-carboxytetrahydropterin synthase